MGTNTITTKRDGDVISAEDPNQYKTAMSTSLVPRNLAGVPTDNAVSFGSALFRWLTGYFRTIYVGDPANGLKITENAGAMSFQVGGVEKGKIDSGGFIGSFLKDASVAYAKRVAMNIQVSSAQASQTVSSTTLADITNLSVTITTTGRPVFVGLLASSGASDCYFQANGVATTDCTSKIAFFRDATALSRQLFGLTATSSQTRSFRQPPSAFFYIDDGLAAGTYTYKAQMAYVAGSAVQAINVKLVAYEMP